MSKRLIAYFHLNSESVELSEFLSREDIKPSKLIPQIKEAIIEDVLEREPSVIVEYSKGYNTMAGKLRGIVMFIISSDLSANEYNNFVERDNIEILNIVTASGKKSGDNYYFVEYATDEDVDISDYLRGEGSPLF